MSPYLCLLLFFSSVLAQDMASEIAALRADVDKYRVLVTVTVAGFILYMTFPAFKRLVLRQKEDKEVIRTQKLALVDSTGVERGGFEIKEGKDPGPHLYLKDAEGKVKMITLAVSDNMQESMLVMRSQDDRTRAYLTGSAKWTQLAFYDDEGNDRVKVGCIEQFANVSVNGGDVAEFISLNASSDHKPILLCAEKDGSLSQGVLVAIKTDDTPAESDAGKDSPQAAPKKGLKKSLDLEVKNTPPLNVNKVKGRKKKST